MSNKIKAKGEVLISMFDDDLTVEFDKNKACIRDMKLPFSKKTNNLMSAYITRAKKKKIKEKAELSLDKGGEAKTYMKKLKPAGVESS
ncbi:MAG: hypothetical protein V1824_04070 [archaeon]